MDKSKLERLNIELLMLNKELFVDTLFYPEVRIGSRKPDQLLSVIPPMFFDEEILYIKSHVILQYLVVEKLVRSNLSLLIAYIREIDDPRLLLDHFHIRLELDDEVNRLSYVLTRRKNNGNVTRV